MEVLDLGYSQGSNGKPAETIVDRRVLEGTHRSGTNKSHPTVEVRMDAYKNKQLASMRASSIEIPMSQTNERSSTASQPMYVGEDDILWMETMNHKKGRAPGFGKIHPCPSLSTRSSHYVSTSRS